MKIVIAILTMVLCAGDGYAFGPRAHRLVGAIADRRLTNSNVEVRKKLTQLLDGMTLQDVSTLPDEIKSWAIGSVPRPDSFHITGHARIEAELRAFVNANSGEHPSHAEFHFADVPVVGNEKYGSGSVGRRDDDIVHIVTFCIGVLKGQIPEKNEHAITKTVAVILLAHLMADIHQPLHVGAQYFDAKGIPFEPSPQDRGFEDQSGNKLNLFLYEKKLSIGRLHAFWDSNIVNLGFGDTPDERIAAKLAIEEPDGWKLGSSVETWGETLANEVLPLAREAYARLEFRNVKTATGNNNILYGDAIERSPNAGIPYESWASQNIKAQIHKAGWRLAALLEELLK